MLTTDLSRACLVLLTLLFANIGSAQPNFPVAGKFYVEIDHDGGLWHNGTRIHYAPYGTSETKEVNLIPGDRLKLRLYTKEGTCGVKLLFVSTDRKYMINFKAEHFKILRDPDKNDFTEKEFATLKEPARTVTPPNKDRLTFKNTAVWLWGEKKQGNTYVGCLVTKGMFEKFMP